MSLTTMYPAINNSPRTVLTVAISALDTEITLDDASVIPAGPNLMVLGTGDDAEIVSYTTITGNVVSGVVRGVNGTVPGAWPINTIAARNFTAQDAEAFRLNILDLDSRKIEGVAWGAITGTLSNQTDLGTAFAAKADLASPTLTGTPKAPTASSGNNSTQIATTAFVQGELDKQILYFTGQAVSAASNAQIMRIPSSGTNSSITTDTVVLNCTFANPAIFASNVTWTSYAGYITFSGTCTTATTANVTLGTKGNS